MAAHKKRYVIGISIAGLCLVIIFIAWLYSQPLTTTKTKIFSNTGLPIALINYKPITMSEINKRYAVATRVYGQNSNFNSADIKTKILDTVVEQLSRQEVADSHGVKATEAERDEQYKASLKQLAGGNENSFAGLLQTEYGLSAEQFKKDILTPGVLKANLTIWYNSQQSLNQAIYKQLADFKKKVYDGANFGDLAKQHSQNEAIKPFGGDTGFIATENLLPEFRKPLNSLHEGDISILASRYGLHLIKVITKDEDPDTHSPRIRLQEILLTTQGYDAWYTQQTQKIKIQKLIHF